MFEFMDFIAEVGAPFFRLAADILAAVARFFETWVGKVVFVILVLLALYILFRK